ncbi:MAG: alanine--tRNA ligase [Candidatus Dependentiae bacterium]|nr:alanine--tRNA ligase [Candidatus Dependentiae bacterium]
MKSLEIRKKFFDFFTKRGHQKADSSSLIPAQDPTLLFANAGMNQFKDLFLGKEKRSYTTAVTIQKCVRAGGKHNDLDNVGFTKRHLTFFEMMGNFSFGDYFKNEAIMYAWEFLTKEMHLPIEKLHATVYKTDDEAYDIWHKKIGIPQERMHRLGEKDNFWQMGDTGPCGPCTEIHLDRGAEFGCKDIKDCGPACDCDRFLEIWNLVFMQYDRQADGTDKPLKQTGVDTGMGLERLCSVVQEKDSVFEIDLFDGIMKKIEEITGLEYYKQDANTRAAFNVLADHVRSSSLIIADGGAPSNEGRGYVLRKIIRRAALFAQKLNAPQTIFPDLSRQLVKDMGDIYPELKTNEETIYAILSSEINKFATNLVRGQNILSRYFEENKATKIITGDQAFKLYDTFGFPLELLHVIAREHDFTVDALGFDALMLKQQEQSGKKTTDELDHVGLDDAIETEFTGYKELETASQVVALIADNQLVNSVAAGQKCWVVTKKSPFFIVGGGQIPDSGWLTIGGVKTPLLAVRYINNAIGALVTVPTSLKVGDTVTELVDKDLRIKAMKNHTATHMLQAALIQLFGKQIKQSGSLVAPDYLRFDFTYHENLSPEDIARVENLVNEKIRENIPLNVEYMDLKQAHERGALAFFGDKYNPEKVRMVEIPHFSVELCGGTHVYATGDIGTFKITEVTALSAGHRRIVAVTGEGAINLFQETFNITKSLSTEFKVKREEVIDAVLKQKEQIRILNAQVTQIKKQLMHLELVDWEKQISKVGSIPYLFIKRDNATHDELKEIVNVLQAKQPGFYFVVGITDARPSFLAHVSSQFSNAIDLKKFATWLNEKHGMRGGGSKNQLQGGGAKLDANLEASIKGWIAAAQNH